MRTRLGIVLLGAALVCAGCAFPYSRPYAPTSTSESQLFPRASRRILPDDVRADLPRHQSQIVLWTGIIKAVHPTTVDGHAGTEILFEHHYWDFIEDHSIQRAIAFLSPRGEGMFTVSFAEGEANPGIEIERMGVVYATPERLAPDGKTIVLRGHHLLTLRRELYATDIWDYGRDFLLKGDKSDFKALRVPMR